MLDKLLRDAHIEDPAALMQWATREVDRVLGEPLPAELQALLGQLRAGDGVARTRTPQPAARARAGTADASTSPARSAPVRSAPVGPPPPSALEGGMDRRAGMSPATMAALAIVEMEDEPTSALRVDVSDDDLDDAELLEIDDVEIEEE